MTCAVKLRLVWAAAIVGISVSLSDGAVDTWDAGGGNDNWSNGNNWGDNTTPTSSDSAVFNVGISGVPVIFSATPAAIKDLSILGTFTGGGATFESSGGAKTLSITAAGGGNDLIVTNATLILGTSPNLFTFNPVNLIVGDDIKINDGTEGQGVLKILYGSDVTADNLTGTTGTISVEGSGSTLTTTSTNLNHELKFLSGADGTINGWLDVGQSADGFLTIDGSGSTVELFDDLTVGTSNVVGRDGTISILNDGVLTHASGKTITVGAASNGSGSIGVSGVLSTGNTLLTINNTGSVSVGGFGQINHNADVLVNGGNLTKDDLVQFLIGALPIQ